MTRRCRFLLAFFVIITGTLTTHAITSSTIEAFDSRGRIELPASKQRIGDAQRGRDYLINGDYIKSGIPLELYRVLQKNHSRNELGRAGESATLPPYLTAIKAHNGRAIASSNCLACHSQELNGEFILGLGNTLRDFTGDNSAYAKKIDQLLSVTELADPKPREAYAAFRDATLAVGPHIRTKVVGTNPALKLALVLGAHRDPKTLSWSETPRFQLPPADEVIPSDVPAFWLLHKKNAMFHNGMGRGDFARTMMASSLYTLRSIDEAEKIDAHFVDVHAYIDTLRPPKYPNRIDTELLEHGEEIFSQRCASCHGTYGKEWSYPNLLIHLDKIGTDPAMALNAQKQDATYGVTYKESWFGQGEHAGRLAPSPGYVAPPLDGIWATAPYLHNGSVPTLEALLDSSLRPRYWRRSFKQQDYDLERVGWIYQEVESGGHKHIYDTTLFGHSAEGHPYADKLDAEQRRALLEYLKSL
ncbi:c-type cytochrome [Coraliomargarita algicola]|uniref:C-type cytochrome n=1 Tax=Coraliomargarita algicola TaxID=3092156 RepID=A0ABZ0RNK5_9BACT|nr:c-type cytochrome [Coraliomargarita sp. J2-16]WPJ97815.1 c-type cytochrome [Coraliomargarita sp. J2-16]